VAAARTQPFPEAMLFFELNHTDGDLGIHGSIDGDAWIRLSIKGPRGGEMLSVEPEGRLARQGMTQLFFESAEPPFDELPPENFFQRFPEGSYTIEARTLERTRLKSVVQLSHVMPAPPENLLVSGQPAAESCDAADLPLVNAGSPVEIRWDPVTSHHPEIGKPGPIELLHYQLFVSELSLNLPPSETSFEVPAAVIGSPAEPVKFEIIATSTTHNNTAVESCFRVQ
jgi:hypothetical protein